MDFGRLITAMVTPFKQQGSIYWAEVERILNHLMEQQQSDSIVIAGTTGEAPTLSEHEKQELFQFAVKKANGRARIIAGVGSNCTAHTIHLTKIAQHEGVDGILLVVPYYNKPTQAGLYRHFITVAQATSLPIMLYNVPSRTVTSLAVDTTLQLAQIPNIVAIKECASLDHISQLVAQAPPTFRVYTGDDPLTLPSLAVGSYGVVSVASHLVGKMMRMMIDHYQAGRCIQALALHQKLYPLCTGLFQCPNPVGIKYVMQQLGFQVGDVRLPLVGATDEEAIALRVLIDTIPKFAAL